jgi:DNA-directed RNA polymerase beta subunit
MMMTKAKATKDDKEKETPGIADEPENKLNNLQDNSVSPDEMQAKKGMVGGKTDPAAANLAAQDADTADRLKEESEERKAEEDTSVHARLARSGYVYNDNHITGERWVGVSIQCDPNADAASRAKTRVTSIAEYPPRKGLTVKPKDGEPFAVSEEFDKDSTPKDWFAVIDPVTKKSFLEGV